MKEAKIEDVTNEMYGLYDEKTDDEIDDETKEATTQS